MQSQMYFGGARSDQRSDSPSSAEEAGLRTMALPSTRVFILVRRKHSMASSGWQTIGSFSLKEVFKTTGTPVRLANSRSEEHTSELQSRGHLVCRLLLEKKKKIKNIRVIKNIKCIFIL